MVNDEPIEDIFRAVQNVRAFLPYFAQGSAQQRGTVLALARLPTQIRGYGHIKARNLAAVRAQWKSLTDTLRTLF